MASVSRMNSSLLLMIIIIASFFLGQSAGKTHPGDVRALRSIKSSISQSSKILPSSCISSWDFSHDPCESSSTSVFTCGFTCDSTSKRIVRLELDTSAYSGQIPASIADLHSLVVLDLSQNSFFGEIPQKIFTLLKLQKLDLSDNHLSGQLPGSASQLQELKFFSVSGNRLNGVFPATLFTSMKNVERVYLDRNQFSGELPGTLSSCMNLEYLDASHNTLTEQSSIFTKLPKSLLQISLRENSMGGKLSGNDIARFQELEVLDLSGNKLSGSVPFTLFTLANLQQLNLSRNHLSSIDLHQPGVDLSGSQLVAVDAGYNMIRGRLPVAFSKMNRLSGLSLSNNFFSDAIPEEYALKVAATGSGAAGGGGAMLPLTRLFLESNYLEGEVPSLLLKPLPNLISASFAFNCLSKCPANLSFCRGSQRSNNECRRSKALEP